MALLIGWRKRTVRRFPLPVRLHMWMDWIDESSSDWGCLFIILQWRSYSSTRCGLQNTSNHPSLSTLQGTLDLFVMWMREENPSWIETHHTWKGSNRLGTEDSQRRRKHSHPNQWISKKASLFITLFTEKQLSNTTVFVYLKLLRLIVIRLSDGRSNGWKTVWWYYPSVWILSQIGGRRFLLLQSSVLPAHHILRHREEERLPHNWNIG